MNMRIPPAVLLAAALAACAPPDRELVAEHPIADSLDVRLDAGITFSRGGLETAPPAVRDLVERIRSRQTVASFGELDGGIEQGFGLLTDAHLTSDGILALLDRQHTVVEVFAEDGSHLQTIARGDGPGELQVPMAFLSPGEGELWILDGSGMLHRFHRGDTGFEFSDRTVFEGFAQDGCVLGGIPFLHVPTRADGTGTEEVVFRMDEAGRLTEGFATPYRYGHRLVGPRMRRGRVLCFSDDLVLLAFEAMNRLDAYRASDGALLWHGSFDAVHVPPLQERILEDGRRAVGIDPMWAPEWHLLLGIVGSGNGLAIVQYGRRSRDDLAERIDRYVVETFVVDPRAGEGWHAGDDLPQVLTATASHLALLLHNDLVPRVEVARY